MLQNQALFSKFKKRKKEEEVTFIGVSFKGGFIEWRVVRALAFIARSTFPFSRNEKAWTILLQKKKKMGYLRNCKKREELWIRQRRSFHTKTIEVAENGENAKCKKKGFYGFVCIDNNNNNIVVGVGVEMTNLEQSERQSNRRRSKTTGLRLSSFLAS